MKSQTRYCVRPSSRLQTGALFPFAATWSKFIDNRSLTMGHLPPKDTGRLGRNCGRRIPTCFGRQTAARPFRKSDRLIPVHTVNRELISRFPFPVAGIPAVRLATEAVEDACLVLSDRDLSTTDLESSNFNGSHRTLHRRSVISASSETCLTHGSPMPSPRALAAL